MKIKEIYSIFQQNPTVCTDSRKITEGAIFFALKGKSFDGNKYAIQSIKGGCSYAIIDKQEYNTHPNTILVKDALKTLQELATHHRKQITIPVIGITGTNGKTTSKELIKVVLNSQLNCHATRGNLNNHIGVPLSILEIRTKHEVAVIEMGANHKNEIEFLCNIAQPTHGVITNIGSAHLEGFGSHQGVIDTKNELYSYIKNNNGELFTNADDALLLNLSQQINKTTYGRSGKITAKINYITPLLSLKYVDTIIKSNLIGEFQFSNILLAICIGKHFNISIKNIKNSIEEYIPTNNRSQIIKTIRNTLILDAYNANPSSMKAMLKSFANQQYKNKLCILGDMMELGKESKNEHQKIISLATELQLKCIFVGEIFRSLSENSYKDRQELVKYLLKNKISNRTILLKGSRGIGLEKLVTEL